MKTYTDHEVEHVGPQGKSMMSKSTGAHKKDMANMPVMMKSANVSGKIKTAGAMMIKRR